LKSFVIRPVRVCPKPLSCKNQGFCNLFINLAILKRYWPIQCRSNKKTAPRPLFKNFFAYIARCILPLLKQRVHTRILRGLPSMMALTRCRLGIQVLLVRMCEWLIFIPTLTPLPQTAHTLAIDNHLLCITTTFYQKTKGAARPA